MAKRMSITDRVRADEIKHAISKRHEDELFLTEVKTGSTWFDEIVILDALAIKKSWRNPCFTGYEVKVSRSDFTRDQKWTAYLNYCHRFYFACPNGLIQPEELPDDVGLIWFNQEKGTLFTKRAARHRNIEISSDLLYYILISRIESDRHPFFSDKRDYFEQFVRDKSNKKALGLLVSKKIGEYIQEMQEKCRKAEREMDRLDTILRTYNKLREILQRYDINIDGMFSYRWEEKLIERLESGISDELKSGVRRLRDDVERLKQIVGV